MTILFPLSEAIDHPAQQVRLLLPLKDIIPCNLSNRTSTRLKISNTDEAQRKPSVSTLMDHLGVSHHRFLGNWELGIGFRRERQASPNVLSKFSRAVLGMSRPF